MREKGILIVVSGFSGSGKGTIMKELLKQYDNYALSISATTRRGRIKTTTRTVPKNRFSNSQTEITFGLFISNLILFITLLITFVLIQKKTRENLDNINSLFQWFRRHNLCLLVCIHRSTDILSSVRPSYADTLTFCSSHKMGGSNIPCVFYESTNPSF